MKKGRFVNINYVHCTLLGLCHPAQSSPHSIYYLQYFILRCAAKSLLYSAVWSTFFSVGTLLCSQNSANFPLRNPPIGPNRNSESPTSVGKWNDFAPEVWIWNCRCHNFWLDFDGGGCL